jgi:hypothetical protein
MTSFYPPGNDHYKNAGSVNLIVDVSKIGESKIGTNTISPSLKPNEKVLEQQDRLAIYVDNPEIQPIDKFIEAAFALDIERSKLLNVVTPDASPDYTLAITVNEHFGYTKTNVLLTILSVYPFIVVGGPLWMPIYKTESMNKIDVKLTNNKTKETILLKSYNEEFEKRYSMAKGLIYNPTYFRIAYLKKIVTNCLADMDEKLK